MKTLAGYQLRSMYFFHYTCYNVCIKSIGVCVWKWWIGIPLASAYCASFPGASPAWCQETGYRSKELLRAAAAFSFVRAVRQWTAVWRACSDSCFPFV